MKFLLRHLLLLGVIIGLAGQGVAFASSPCAMMQMGQVSAKTAPMAGMPDCDMGHQKPDKTSAPCKEMGAGCLAMAGCSPMLGLDALSMDAVVPLMHSIAAIGTEPPALIGRNISPDPYPPSLLG